MGPRAELGLITISLDCLIRLVFSNNSENVASGEESGTMTQLRAARLAGLLFLIAMATGLFAEFYVHFPSSLVVVGDAGKTAVNLAAKARLYRIGIANNIITFAVDVVLIWALYLLLKPVNKSLAVLAVLFRMVETTLALVAIIQSYVAMEYITDHGQHSAIDPGTMTILHYIYALTFNVVAIFLGLGSAVFNLLFLKSGYVPKALAVWGIFAALVLLVSQFTIIVFPEIESTIIPACYVPIALDEIALGFWLLIKGVRISDGTNPR